MADGEDGQDVLGSLPRRRPGIKSPRRAGARQAAQQAAEQRQQAPPPPSQPRAEPQPGDLERIVRAGVGVGIGATALGLKVAGRALGGVGRVVGRR